MRLIAYGLMLVFLTGCGKNEQAQGAPSVAPVADEAPAKVEPKHFYEGREGSTYFYSRGVSENEKQSGTVANEMLEILYLGSKENGYQFLLKSGGTNANILTCKAPCDFYTENLLLDGEVVKTSRFKNAVGSVAWAVFSDAARGELEPAKMKINGKIQNGWFSTDKGRFIPLVDNASR